MKLESKTQEKYLEKTYFIDTDSELVFDIAYELTRDISDPIEKAKSIFYWTRDKIPYDPYSLSFVKRNYKASNIIRKGRAWCVPKAVVLATLARAVKIPSRLHFADIRNHQITPKLKKEMGTDLFIFHGYTELYLNGKWIKATPAFNIELCQKFDHKSVEFDGINDGMLPKTTLDGQKHIEYLNDRGTFADLPLKHIFDVFMKTYMTTKGTLNIFSR